MFYGLCGGKDMKKNKKYSGLLLICFICIWTGVSCKKNETVTTEPTINTTVTVQTESTKTPKVTEVPKDTATATTIPIYSINNETLETENVMAELPEGQKLDAEFIINEVVKSFSDRGIEIGIYAITEKEDGVCVSFEKDKAPIVAVGSSVEMTILDSIAQSLLDNLDDCQKVYFMAEDGPYESGHNVFEIDEPYTWK